MANKTFNGLDSIRGDGTVAGTDVVVLSQADSEGGANDVAKKTTVGDLATTVGTELGLGTAATTASTDYATAAQGTLADGAIQSDAEGGNGEDSITNVIALTDAQYTALTPKQSSTLYVISDGQSDAEAINDILQLSTDFADFKSRMNTAYGS